MFLFFCNSEVKAQKPGYIQIDLSGGVSEPLGSFSNRQMFATRGQAFSGGFDYFFKHVGLGLSAGYFTNLSGESFAQYMTEKYYEKIELVKPEYWNTKYVAFGPSFKLSAGRFDLDFFARGGYSQITVPNLSFVRTFFNQDFAIYNFGGNSDKNQFAWTGGTRLSYKFNNWLGIQAKADYFSTSYLSSVGYTFTYRNATDNNRNGILEDSEYFESQKVSKHGSIDLNVVNVNMGLIFQLGKPKADKTTVMIPVQETPDLVTNEVVEKKVEEPIKKPVEEPVKQEKDVVIEEKTEQTKPAPVVEEKEVKKEVETPIINANEVPANVVVEVKDLPKTTYDAPESKYDAEAAEFLYKAGETYFASNDFENATPCFNKLKADPNYPRAKYMFALSLAAMGNCAEAKNVYSEFAKSYKDSDARTLEIIFASHLEKCHLDSKSKNMGKTNLMKPGQTDVKTENTGKSYKIQFIAIRKPNASFPKLAEVGVISTEFYPNKSVFRYSLDGYKDFKAAVADVYKVRKMGFRDAFIAVYQDGVRVNTLYHAK